MASRIRFEVGSTVAAIGLALLASTVSAVTTIRLTQDHSRLGDTDVARRCLEQSAQRRFRQPYFWAAFGLQGDWR